MARIRLTGVVFSILAVLTPAVRGQDGEACARIFGAHFSAAGKPAPKLSKPELEQLTEKRACIKSYGLPGGAENLSNLTSAEILKDNQRLQNLFDIYAALERKGVKDPDVIIKSLKSRFADLSTEDFGRMLHIAAWDRSQVSLYGDWLYLKKLREEGQFSKAVSVASDAVKKYNLRFQDAPQTEADEHTYFSAPALGNMLLLELLSSRSRLLDAQKVQPSDLQLFVSLLDRRDSLAWQFAFVGGDPSMRMVSRLKGLYGRVAGSADTEELPPLGKLDVTAGYYSEANRSVVLLKGRRTYGLVEDADGVTLLDPIKAASDFRNFSRRAVIEKSTAEMRLLGVHSYDGKYEVDFGDETYAVSNSEYQGLTKGQQLTSAHPLHRAIAETPIDQAIVLYTHPLALKYNPLQTRADTFLFSLQRAYPGRSIYRDPYSERTPFLARQLKTYALPDNKDLFAVVAEDSFEVKDFKIVQNIKDDLVKAGVTIISFTKTQQPSWTNGQGKAVIVITGHIDQNLARFVSALGERGYFEGNYVVFNSCRSPLSRMLVNRISSRYKAAAAFSFDSKIQTASVEDFLIELTQANAADKPVSFDNRVREAAQKAKLNGIWTICLDRNHPPIGLPPSRIGNDLTVPSEVA